MFGFFAYVAYQILKSNILKNSGAIFSSSFVRTGCGFASLAMGLQEANEKLNVSLSKVGAIRIYIYIYIKYLINFIGSSILPQKTTPPFSNK